MKKIVCMIILFAIAFGTCSCSLLEDGDETSEIYIGDNGNWFIYGEDSGVKAKGEDGKDGIDGKDGVDGINGKDGKDGKDGNKYILTEVEKTITISQDNIYNLVAKHGDNLDYSGYRSDTQYGSKLYINVSDRINKINSVKIYAKNYYNAIPGYCCTINDSEVKFYRDLNYDSNHSEYQHQLWYLGAKERFSNEVATEEFVYFRYDTVDGTYEKTLNTNKFCIDLVALEYQMNSPTNYNVYSKDMWMFEKIEVKITVLDYVLTED